MNALTKIGSGIGKSLMRCKPIAKAVMKVSKNKPEILAATGGVMIVAAFGWAIYEAVMIKPVLDSTAAEVEEIETVYKDRDKMDVSDDQKAVVERSYKKELTKARVHGVLKVGRKFVGPCIVLAVGMTCTTQGFKILRARNLFLGGALKSTEEAYKFYRNNVKEELGDEADKKFARGIIGEQEIEETKKDAAGNDVQVKTKVPVVKDRKNPWRFEFSEEWFSTFRENTDMNLFFLKMEQDWWQHVFTRDGSVTIYEILKHMQYNFDLAKSSMTKKQYVEFMNFIRNYGWWKDSKGDGFIDFGIYRAINEPAIARKTDVVFIEFNCDGNLQTM